MNKITAFLLSFLLSIGMGACCLKVPALSAAISARGNLNLLTYALQIVSFCILYLVFYGCLQWKFSEVPAKTSPLALPSALALALGNLIFFLLMFQLEVNIYGGVSTRYIWHKLPLWLVLLCLAGELALFLLCFRGGTIQLPEYAPFFLYGILTVLIGYTFYTPSIFVRGYSDRLHAHAYYNSIYNVLHGSPYGEEATSIYGHYGILYRLPMKLLGGDFIDFILLNSILGALCFLAMFLAIHFLVKNNLLRLLGALSMTFPVLSMRGGYYWQLWPHRILFMSLLICFAAVCVHFHLLHWSTCLLGYLLCILGILWNTESGLFCTIAWAGFWILHYLCKCQWRFPGILGTGILHLGAIFLSFFTAYGIVNLYNLAMGGTWNSLKEFLFPLLTTSYMDDLLRVNLPEYPSAYLPVLGLFCLAVAWGISHMRIFHPKHQPSPEETLPPCFAFFAGVLSLGQMSYFMNRAAYHNLDICHLPAMLLMCLLAERGMSFTKTFRFREWKKYSSSQIFQGAFTAISLGVLLTVSTGNLIQYGYNADLKTQFHNKKEIHDFAAHIGANIPENTYAFGIGVPELYSMLRWDTQCYTLDFSDLSVRPQVADYLIEDIKAKDLDSFLAGEKSMEHLARFASDENKWLTGHYKLSQEFEFQGAIFQYYTKAAS